MNTIKAFNPANLKELRTEISAAISAVETKFGIKLDLGKITYQADNFGAKLTGSTMAADGSEPLAGNPTWRRDFKSYAYSFGLKPEDLGRTLVYNRKPSTIVGARPRANLPIVLADAAGKTFAVPADVVARLLVAA
jgi:hypothetical protein